MVIIGAGEAGARAAQALREEGFTGPVTLIGAEAAAPYERPPLSKSALLDPAGPSPAVILSAQRAAELNIDLITGTRVEAIDRAGRRAQLSDGRVIGYTKLLIATGASARRLPNLPHAHYLRTFEEARRLRASIQPGQRIAVIGGGFIGLELAASARQLGAEVTVYEMAPRLLARAVPADIAGRMQLRHEARGVKIITGASSDEVTAGAAQAELVIAGIGASPDVALAEAAGLAIENGIRTDATLATSDPDIYAAGDCCSFPLSIYRGRRVRLESWRNAQEQGTLAARNMLGANDPHAAVPWFWSDQFDKTLQIAGLCDEGPVMITRHVAADAVLNFHLAEDGTLKAASAFGENGAIAREVRLAEMLIAKQAKPDLAALADPSVKLKSLLK